MKVCSKCKKEQLLENFYKNKSIIKDGLHSQCKSCTYEYIELNREKILTYNRLYNRSGKRKIYTKLHKKEKSIYDKSYRNKLEKRYSSYKDSSLRRKIDFKLTLEDFSNISSQVCFYCKEYNKGKNFCGIDRMNNKLGYVLTNCVACCKLCNYMKLTLSVSEWLDHIEKVLVNMKNKKEV